MYIVFFQDSSQGRKQLGSFDVEVDIHGPRLDAGIDIHETKIDVPKVDINGPKLDIDINGPKIYGIDNHGPSFRVDLNIHGSNKFYINKKILINI